MLLPTPPLLVISDRSQARHPLTETAAACFAGGCRWFSLREKNLPAAERRALLADIAVLARPYGAVVGVHDDLDAEAAAVHLPAGSDPAAVRRKLPRALIGVSAHEAGEAASAIAGGADYVTVSPVFLTDSKPGYGPALGLGGLARAAVAAKGPVLALAGISPANAGACLAAGAAGVAVMGEAMRAEDPEAVVRALLGAMGERTWTRTMS